MTREERWEKSREEFRERIRQKVLSINPSLEGKALDQEISDEWARYLRSDKPDPFLSGAERPSIPLAEGLESLTDWRVIVDAYIERNPLHYDRAGLWYCWNHRRKAWELIDEVDLLNAFDEASRKSTLRSSVRAEVVEALKRRARLNEPKTPPATWVQFGDEVVDVASGTRKKASSEYRLTNPVPWKIGSGTDTPKIDALLKSWAGEHDDAPDWRTLKSWAAYCCLPDTPVHAFLFLYGSGSNGKSVFLRLLALFLGQPNTTSTTLERLETNRFEMFGLRHKLLAIVGETEVAVLERSGPLKTISGGDPVVLEPKGKNPFSETLFTKLIIASNAIPSTRDRTVGFYRRALVVDFPNQFIGDSDPLADVPRNEFENLALWAAEVELPRIVRERTIRGQGSIEQRRQRYEARSDVLGQFLNEHTIASDGDFAPMFELFDTFKTYCLDRGHRSMSSFELGQQMTQKGYEKTRTRVAGRENAIWGYEGLRVKVSTHSTQSHIRNQVRSVNTFDTPNLFDRFRALFSGSYAGRPLSVEVVQRKLPEVSDEVLRGWLARGDAVENPAGWVMPT